MAVERSQGFKNLTINYKQLMSIPVADRVDMVQSNLGRQIMSALTPDEIARAFPRYYSKTDPGVARGIKALSGGGSAGERESEGGVEGTTRRGAPPTEMDLRRRNRGNLPSAERPPPDTTPAWMKSVERATGVNLSRRGEPEQFDGGKISSGYEASGLSASMIRNYIREEAKKRGIDPEIAVRVAESEGMRYYQSRVPVRGGGYERSFGPFQLFMGDGQGRTGLGNAFKRDTGIDPETDRSADSVKAGIRYALDNAAKNKTWEPWKGAARVGIPNDAGFGRDTKAIGWQETETSRASSIDPSTIPPLPEGIDPKLKEAYGRFTPFQQKNFHEALGKLGQGGKNPIEEINRIFKENPSIATVAGTAGDSKVLERHMQTAGVRKLPVKDELKSYLNYAMDRTGIAGFESTSGGQNNRTGRPAGSSFRHDIQEGTVGAIDGRFFIRNEKGEKQYLPYNDPRVKEAVKLLSGTIPGAGIGANYMQGRSGGTDPTLVHIGGPNTPGGAPVLYTGRRGSTLGGRSNDLDPYFDAGQDPKNKTGIQSDYRKWLEDKLKKEAEARARGREPQERVEAATEPQRVPTDMRSRGVMAYAGHPTQQSQPQTVFTTGTNRQDQTRERIRQTHGEGAQIYGMNETSNLAQAFAQGKTVQLFSGAANASNIDKIVGELRGMKDDRGERKYNDEQIRQMIRNQARVVEPYGTGLSRHIEGGLINPQNVFVGRTSETGSDLSNYGVQRSNSRDHISAAAMGGSPAASQPQQQAAAPSPPQQQPQQQQPQQQQPQQQQPQQQQNAEPVRTSAPSSDVGVGQILHTGGQYNTKEDELLITNPRTGGVEAIVQRGENVSMPENTDQVKVENRTEAMTAQRTNAEELKPSYQSVVNDELIQQNLQQYENLRETVPNNPQENSIMPNIKQEIAQSTDDILKYSSSAKRAFESVYKFNGAGNYFNQETYS